MTNRAALPRKLARDLLTGCLIACIAACASDKKSPPAMSDADGGGDAAGAGTGAGARAGTAAAADCSMGHRIGDATVDCTPPVGPATRDAGIAGAAPARPTFMTRRGNQLYYDGQPYKGVGINAFGMAGCDTGLPYSDAEMDEYFAALRPLGLTRAWAFQAQGMAGVARMVRSAETHSQLLILSFADGRGYCGEKDGRIGDEGSGKHSSWYSTGYKTRYLPWVESVVTRFKDSPAIALWELINEPGGDGVSDQTMREFFDDAAAHVKAIDKNHLVMSGTQADYVQGTSDYAYVHGGPAIDAASLHEYDYEDSNHTIVSLQLRPTLAAMRSIDKPLLISEVGIRAGTSMDCTGFDSRRNVLRQKLDAYMPQDGVAAVIVWSWVPKPRSGCVYEATSSDPLMALLKSYP